MYSMKEYQRPETLGQAYELLIKSRKNALLGGTTFLRLTARALGCAIDLCGLGLDRLYVDEVGRIHIGAMCTLRALEVNPLIIRYAGGLLSEATGHIVGVQFRSAATVGATVFSRYGFSDVISPLLACGARIKLFHQGELSLADFLTQPACRDILLETILPAATGRGAFTCLRNSCSDFAILNAAVYADSGCCRIAVGARPAVAQLSLTAGDCALAHCGESTDKWVHSAARCAAEELSFSSNMRGSAAYRAHLCEILVGRLLHTVYGRAPKEVML